jgi:hypothetical protein
MNRNDSDFFWPSYVDLMTALFAIGLVLFVLSYTTLSSQMSAFEMKAKEHDRLQQIQKSIEHLEDSTYFRYDPQYRRHVFVRSVFFKKQDYVILPQYHEYLLQAGRRIQRLIADLKQHSEKDVRYLLIVEGMSSEDNYDFNYELSYQRALSLFRFWDSSNVKFDPRVCEVQLSGSGTGGIGRDSINSRNQRFIIQIVPKIDFQ